MPQESHISCMLNITHDDELTAKANFKFIRYRDTLNMPARVLNLKS